MRVLRGRWSQGNWVPEDCRSQANSSQVKVVLQLRHRISSGIGMYKASCQQCHKRHHTSICDQTSEQNSGKQTMMTASGSGEGVFPVLTVKVDGTTCRMLADSGAGTSYVSAKLVNLLDKKPSETNTKRVDMLMSSWRRRSGGGRASCLRRRINTRSRCSCVRSSSTAQRHYPAISGCQTSTRQIRAHDTSTWIDSSAHGHQLASECMQRTGQPAHTANVRMARQHGRPPLDEGQRPVQAVCR